MLRQHRVFGSEYKRTSAVQLQETGQYTQHLTISKTAEYVEQVDEESFCKRLPKDDI
jgi:hypothetical protein